MDRTRLDQQLVRYEKALAALRDAVDTDGADKKSRDSILLSFVFTFEMAWRSLRFALDLLGVQSPDYAAAALRAGFQAEVITDVEGWDRLRECRNDVAHAYDEQKAIAIAAFVRQEGLDLLEDLLDRLRSNG